MRAVKGAKNLVVAVLGLSLFITAFLTTDVVYALEENNINVEINQEYQKEKNQVEMSVTTSTKEGYEVTGIMKDEEERSNVTSNKYLITKNGDVHVTVYYQEKGNDDNKEEVKVYTEKVTDIIKQEEPPLEKETPKEDMIEETKEVEQEIGVAQSVAAPAVKQASASMKNATDSKYFIFGKPNTITSYSAMTGAPKDVVIPTTYVDDKGAEQEVLYIGERAFSGQQLTSLVLNDNLKTIEGFAFYNNPSIKEVNIPKNLISIGESAFSQCVGLVTVDIKENNSLETIGDQSFIGTQLTTINIGICSNLKSIGSSAFSATQVSAINLPEGLVTIGDFAFSSTKLTSIVIPDSVTNIRDPFSYCTDLADITIGSGVAYFEVPNGITVESIKMRIPSKEYNSLPGLNATPTNPNISFYWKSNDASCYYEKEGVIYGFKPIDHKTHQECKQHGDHSYIDINNVLFTNSITTIAKQAFYKTSATSLKMSDSITNIEEQAFYTGALQNIQLSNNLVSIGEMAFYINNQLQEVILPDSVQTIGNSAFSGLAISTLTLSDNLKTIGVSAFADCINLKAVTIGNKLETISEKAFINTGITKLKLPDSVKSIGPSAFEGTKKLLEIDLGQGLTSIGDNAFDNSGITEIVIPDSVTSMGRGVFSSSSLSDITIGSGVTTLDKADFSNIAAGLKIRIPSKEVNGITEAPWNATNAQLYWKSEDASCYYEKEGIIYGFKPMDHHSHTDCKQNNDHTYVELHDALFSNPIKEIYQSAFESDTTITSVAIHDNLEKIGDRAFYGTNIETVDFNDSLKIIGNESFSGTRKLTTIEFPNRLKSIGERAFLGSDITGKVVIPDSVTTMMADVFGAAKITDLTIGSGITELPDIIDSYPASSAIKIRIPSKEVGELKGAPWGIKGDEKYKAIIYWKSDNDTCFYTKDNTVFGLKPNDHETHNCGQGSTHEYLEIPESINGVSMTKIAADAFHRSNGYHLNKVTPNIILPDSITEIGDGAFYGFCNTIDFGEGLEVIGERAFSAAQLESVQFPDSLKVVKKSAFSGCSELSEANFGKVETMGEAAFQSTKITNLVIPDSVISLGLGTFSHNSNLETVKVGSGLAIIPQAAFEKCPKLSEVSLSNTITSIERYSFQECTNLKSIQLPEGLKTIGDEAFKNSGLESIALPNSLVTLGAGAFTYAEKLESVTFGNSLKVIGMSAFLGATSLDNIVMPDNIETISVTAFKKCSNLKNVQFSNNTKSIYKEAFDSSGIEHLVMPDSLTYVESGAFRSCKSLLDVHIGANLKNIREAVFADNVKLSKVYNAERITDIGNYAFQGCTNLTALDATNLSSLEYGAFDSSGLVDFTVPSSLRTIPMGAFKDCKNLTVLTIEEGVTSIQDDIISNTKIEEIELPNSVTDITDNSFRNSNVKAIYVGQLRGSCTFRHQQPWGATDSTKVYYRGEYIERSIDVTYNADYTEAYITVDFKAEKNGYIKKVEMPDGHVYKNMDTETYTVDMSTITNGEFTFKVTSSFDQTRDVKVIIDLLNPLRLDGHDAKIAKRSVDSLTEEEILQLVEARGYLIYGGPNDTVEDELDVTITSPSLNEIKEALATSGECEIELYTEGSLPNDTIVLKKNKKVIIRAVDEYTVRFLSGDHGSLVGTSEVDVLEGTLLSDLTMPTVTADTGWDHAGWNPTLDMATVIDEDKIFTATYAKDMNQWVNVTFESGEHGSIEGISSFEILKGSNLSSVTIPTVTDNYGWNHDGWDPIVDVNENIAEDKTFTATYTKDMGQWTHVTFEAGDHGRIEGTTTFEILKGSNLSSITIPTVTIDNGWTHIGWSPTLDVEENVTEDKIYTATYTKDMNQWVRVSFEVGDHGSIDGVNTFEILKGTKLSNIIIPIVTADNGWTHIGWNPTLEVEETIMEDKTFTARYNEIAVIVPEEADTVLPTAVIPTNPIVPLRTIAPTTVVPPNNPLVEGIEPEQELEQPTVDLEENIEDNEVPLAKTNSDTWALVNLGCTMITVLLGLLLVLSKNRKEEKEQKQVLNYRRQIWTKVVVSVFAIVSIVMFILTEDISLKMTMVDNWTMLMAVITGMQLVTFIIGRQWKNDDKDNKGTTNTINQMS